MNKRVRSSFTAREYPNSEPPGFCNVNAFLVTVVEDVSKRKISPDPSLLFGALTASELPSLVNAIERPNLAGT